MMSKFFPTLIALVILTGSALSAPLFPDLRETHWAKDAVAQLAAKGVIEGYPDGTFKGDRAASRWELAMIVARTLQKLDTEQQTFASKADHEALAQLVKALREELDALGVRVTNLEERTDLLDRRVSELERITFYGSIDARYVGQSFRNTGVSDNDSLRNGGGLPGGVPFANYDQIVGTAAGGLFRPAVNGVLPVMDFDRGRLLSNGTGFTSRAVLGVNIDVNDDIKAGLELAAFASQGDIFVDGYWGLNAPYMANVGAANTGGGGAQPLNHQPFTRMVFDKFWLEHSSGVKLQLGSLDKLKMSPMVYQGHANACLEGPRRLNFGFAVSGKNDLDSQSWLDWEVFKSEIGGRNLVQGTSYKHDVFGADIAYVFHEGAGSVQLNAARYMDEALAGAALTTGLLGFNNVAYGASAGWSPLQWVNPPGHFAAQRSLAEQLTTGGATVGLNTADTRPIAGWNGAADNAIGVPIGAGNYGPQSMNNYGLEARYRWKFEGGNHLGVQLDFARSDFKSNRNSSYTSEGDAFRVALDGRVFDRLDWDVSYISVDPQYSPVRVRNGLVGARFPSTFNVSGAFHLNDFNTFQHNREGFRLGLKTDFDERKGSVWLKGEWLDQKQTSLYDVRVTPGSLGAGTPNFPVIGYTPGFIDRIFSGFAHPNLYGANSANSFTTNLTPLENPRGKTRSYEVGASYKWDDPQIDLRGRFRHMDFDRPSQLSAGFGGSQNLVDMKTDYLFLEGGWRPSKAHRLSAGLEMTKVKGHFDPGGLFNAYANRIGSTDFVNLDSTQTVPFVGYDWDIDEKTNWSFLARRYDTDDNVDPRVAAGRALDTVGSSVAPFSWAGWQVTTQYSLKF